MNLYILLLIISWNNCSLDIILVAVWQSKHQQGKFYSNEVSNLSLMPLKIFLSVVYLFSYQSTVKVKQSACE